MRLALAVAAAALLSVATTASAQAGLRGTGVYGTAGCGLGSMVFGNQPGGVQVLAATTNFVIFPVQTFAMTSGTSNCGPGLIAEGMKNFVEANREVLAKDMSRGQGETIGALTWMASCSDSVQVGAVLQAHYGQIFTSEQATSDDVAKALLDTLKADTSLGCHVG